MLTWGLFAQSASFQPLWREGVGAMPALCPAWLPCPGARHRWHERNFELERETQGIHLGARIVASWWNKLSLHTIRIHSGTTEMKSHHFLGHCNTYTQTPFYVYYAEYLKACRGNTQQRGPVPTAPQHMTIFYWYCINICKKGGKCSAQTPIDTVIYTSLAKLYKSLRWRWCHFLIKNMTTPHRLISHVWFLSATARISKDTEP